MAMADPILRLEHKIDELNTTIGSMNTCVTQLTTRFENYPSVAEQVHTNDKRLTALESLEVRKYSSRLQRLEESISSFKGWLAGATAVAACTGALVAWALTKLVAVAPPT